MTFINSIFWTNGYVFGNKIKSLLEWVLWVFCPDLLGYSFLFGCILRSWLCFACTCTSVRTVSLRFLKLLYPRATELLGTNSPPSQTLPQAGALSQRITESPGTFAWSWITEFNLMPCSPCRSGHANSERLCLQFHLCWASLSLLFCWPCTIPYQSPLGALLQ